MKAKRWRRFRLQVFCQPPVATVGYSEKECVANFSGQFEVYVSKFKTMRNTLSGRDDRTMMKLIVHTESDTVVGVHMVGPDAPEIMQVQSLRVSFLVTCYGSALFVQQAFLFAEGSLSRLFRQNVEQRP
jgi:pyruvate/2-oxoglutarate dehydrogenase complex dihydrolipoamide dehydrogenase (E3) component